MNPKLKIDGQPASKLYNLRTTDFIYNAIAMEASSKNTSVNVIINNVLLATIKADPSLKQRLLRIENLL